MAVVDSVLYRLGISYVNVTLGASATGFEQMDLFSSVGLLISSHSSQLKNLAFATDNTIVVEVKADMYSEAFSDGTQHMFLIYRHSIGHEPDPHDVNVTYANDLLSKARIYSKVILNETIFEQDVLWAMDQQRKRCGNIWGNP